MSPEGTIWSQGGPKIDKNMKIIEKQLVFLGFGARHGAEVAKTLCFPRVLRAWLQKPRVFLCFESEHGRDGSDFTPTALYQIRQNPYNASTVWGTIEIQEGPRAENR